MNGQRADENQQRAVRATGGARLLAASMGALRARGDRVEGAWRAREDVVEGVWRARGGRVEGGWRARSTIQALVLLLALALNTLHLNLIPGVQA